MSGVGPLVLAGGGHTHALLLKRWAMRPRTRPQRVVVLVNRHGTTLYSGMVPGLIAGIDDRDALTIDLRQLCARAGVAFISAEITGLVLRQQQLLLNGRPPLHYGLLSLNVGAVSKPTAPGMPIKPLEPALAFLAELDTAPSAPLRVVGGGAAGVEVILALRRRWPQRPLELQTRPGQPDRSQRRALKQANIAVVDARQAPPRAVLLCSGSCAPRWLAEAGLPVADDGRVLTDASLMVEQHPTLFASGDCAVIRHAPRPASGVWAVRAALPLARNLEAASAGTPLRRWQPQRDALQLIGDSSGPHPSRAWARRGAIALSAQPWLWRWKRGIDLRFMEGFRPPSTMEPDKSMACRGCAAKLPAESLATALQQAGLAELGSAPEDAVSPGGDSAWLQSVDGFPALLSDPWLNGRLTALHACSDLWACGARVKSAMTIITLPAVPTQDQQDLLVMTLAGIRSALEPQEALVIGGHTLESRSDPPEPASLGIQVSLSVNGRLARSPWPKTGIRPGDALLISRPLGTGVLFAAAMAGAANPDHLDQALAQMARSQHTLLDSLLDQGDAIHACTDITGFGLLGHLGEMLARSELRLTLLINAIPAYPGALDLLERGHASSLAPANRTAWRWLDGPVQLIGASTPARRELLVDPQTCGPLLLACDATAARSLIDQGPWIRIGTAEPDHG